MILSPHKSLICTPWLWIPRPLNFAAPGGYPCCCEKHIEVCSYCDDDAAPEEILVSLRGIANGSCANCNDYNDDFVFTWNPNGSCGCLWSKTIEDDCYDAGSNGTFFISNGWAEGLGGYYTQFWTGDLSGFSPPYTCLVYGAPFRKLRGASRPDCVNWDEEDLPYFSAGYGECDFSGATCKITAL